MQEIARTVIGYIVDVQGNVLTATLVEDEQGHAPTVTIGDEDIVVGRIGSYVVIRQNAVQIIAMVTRMTEQEALATPTIETPGEQSARLPFAKRLARLTPIGSIDPDGYFERGVGQYPTTGAEVHAIGSAEITKMFERFHAEGFEVGALTSHPLNQGLVARFQSLRKTLGHPWTDRIRKVMDRRLGRTEGGDGDAEGTYHHSRLAWRVLLEAGGWDTPLCI